MPIGDTQRITAGERFDVKAIHGIVLIDGALPMDVPEFEDE